LIHTEIHQLQKLEFLGTNSNVTHICDTPFPSVSRNRAQGFESTKTSLFAQHVQAQKTPQNPKKTPIFEKSADQHILTALIR